MNLKNIKVEEYFKMKNVYIYDSLLKHLKPCNKFSGVEIEIIQLPYSTIKYIQKIFKKNKLEIVDICNIFLTLFGITKEDFYQANIKEFYQANIYIKQQFELIAKNENILNESINIDISKWKASGADRLNNFDLIGLHSISERYGIYLFDLANKPYQEIFYLQSMLKIYDEVNFNYNKND